MVPASGEVEPQSVDMTIAGTEQVVLLHHFFALRDEGVRRRVGDGGRDLREERRQLLPDDPLAHSAEGVAQRTHAACVLRAIGAAVVIVGTLEGADGGGAHRVRLGVTLRAVGVRGGRHRRRRRDEVAPLVGGAVGVDGDVRFGRLGRRVPVAVGVDTAAGRVFVLVREAEGGVAHLVQADLVRARREGECGDRTAGAPVDARVDHHHGHMELGYLVRGDGEGGRVVDLEQTPDAAVAEGGVEVGARRGPGTTARGRVVRSGVGGTDVYTMHVDRGLQVAERRCGEECCDEGLHIVVVLRQLTRLITVAHDDKVPACVVRPVVDDFRYAHHLAVARRHDLPPEWPLGSSCSGKLSTRRSVGGAAPSARAPRGGATSATTATWSAPGRSGTTTVNAPF